MNKKFLGASALILSIAMAGGAQAADGDAAAESELEGIIVTGTRTTGLRAVDSPAPITVLDSTALSRVGQTDLIQAIAQNVPSFNAQAFGGDTANLTLSAKLRGLSPNHALVLINGKRRHGTANLAVLGGPFQGGASADLNFISLGAVSHIEVLQEGAAAQYGSDAIAGVINIILKDAPEGGGATASAGKYMSGGGETADLTLNVGFAPFENSYLNLSYQTRYHDYSFRGDVDPRVTNTPFNINSSSRLSRYPQLVNHPDFPYMNRIAGDAEYRLNIGSYNFGITFGEVEVYSFGTYGDKYASAFENYRVPNLIVGRDGSIPRPFGFSPREVIYETDYAATFGLKTKTEDGWNVDIATTYGKDNVSIYVKDSFNRSLYIDTSTPTTPGSSPTDFYAGAFIFSQWTSQIDVSKEYDVGMAAPLNVAFGGEYRREEYEIKPGDPASRYKEGSQSYPGFQFTDAGKHDRRSYAVYGNVALSPSEPLKLDLAARYEHFSDFGSTFIVKGTGRYDFNEMIAIRGTASTGFRAPTLAESYYSATNVSPTSAFVQLPPNSAAAALVGVNGLDAEKSRNFSVGFVAHPGFGITATLDVYQINIKDRIVGSGSLFGSGGDVNIPAVRAAIIANGNVLDPTVTQTGINIFTNGLNTRTRGAELVVTTSTDLADMGSIQWSLTGNFTDTKVTKIAKPPAQLTGASLFDLTSIGNLETTSPDYRFVLGALWTWDKLSVNLKETLYGPASRFDSRTGCSLATGATSPTCFKNKIDATFITDLEISYRILEPVKITIGANNLFNKYPDKLNPAYRNTFLTGNANGFVTQYPTFSSFGINGGYYYGKIAYTF
ncbi:TonB-dependent receptor plug domain-containing protein [Phenylobacterium sp.]|uniref:TonB-dependent receptor plug domain-containing protein n=1 Tax=Phenylobacterium sp. TaxID=1871053 RepID=UPI003D2B53E3